MENSAGNRGNNSSFEDPLRKHEQSGFNWVTERLACSLPRVFETLLQQIEGDVQTRNSLRPPNSPYEFSVLAKGEEFVVSLTSNQVQSSVTFRLLESSIAVHDDNGELAFEIFLVFDEEGVCRLTVDGEQLKFWQVRRKALEKLMFHAN